MGVYLAPAPAPSTMSASLAPLPEGGPPPVEMGPMILITFRGGRVSLNITNSTDYVTPAPPSLPGLILVNEAPFLGTRYYRITDGTTDVTVKCQSLLRDFPQIQICEPDVKVGLNQVPVPVPNPPPSATPNDPLLSSQYALTAINVAETWSSGNFGDKRVRVCLIDSGLDATHEDIRSNLVTGTSFVGGVQNNVSYKDMAGHGGFKKCRVSVWSRVCIFPSPRPRWFQISTMLVLPSGLLVRAGPPRRHELPAPFRPSLRMLAGTK